MTNAVDSAVSNDVAEDSIDGFIENSVKNPYIKAIRLGMAN